MVQHHVQYLPSPHAYSTILPPTATTPPFRIQLDSLPSLTSSGGESESSLPPADIVLSVTLASKQALERISELTQDNSIGQPTNDLLSSGSSNTESMQDVRDATTSRDLLGGVGKRDNNTSNIDFSTLPEPNKLLQATLRRALAETQPSRAPTPSSPVRPSMKKASELPIDVGVQRWALSCLLHHYLGEDFGQIKQDDGVTSYARDERDDLAIREFFPDPRRFSVVDAELSPSTQSIESMGHAQEAGMSALLDTSKRDDKLKWLLGEFVPTHTVRRRNPLPPASASAGASRRNGRSQRMVARSPTAYQPRRSFAADQGWLSDAEIEEVIHLRRSSSTGMGPPLSPPHRRAWSADSDMTNILKTGEASSLGSIKSPSQAYTHTRESFDTTSTSARDWNGGASLSRIDSYDTYDSQSHLIAHRHRLSEASDSRTSHKAQIDTVKDTSPKHSPKQAAGADLLDFARSSRPFMNLSSARPSVDSVQPVSALASMDILSPTTNDLSAQDKQNLVKKNKKLVAMLGEAPRKEQQPGQVPRLGGGVQVQQYQEHRTDSLSEYSMPLSLDSRLNNFLSDSPANATFRLHYSGAQTSKDDFMAYPRMVGSSSTSLNQQEQQGTRLSRSLSVGSSSYSGGMRRDSNRSCHVEVSQLSPIAASFVSDDGSATSPIAIIQRPAWTEADIAREARRRKLMKIQAFLGERVPASAISDVAGKATIPPASGRTRLPIFTKASHKLQRRLTKSKHTGGSLSDREAESRKGSNRNLRTEMYHEGSHSMDERSRSNSQTSDSNTEDHRSWPSTQKSQSRRQPTISAVPQDPALGEIGKAAEPVILAVRRARKLEKVIHGSVSSPSSFIH